MKSIKFLEEHGVDIQSSMNVFGDEETYNSTLGEFLVGIHTKINQLIKLFEANDLFTYEVYVHSMKNDAKSFGFKKLAEIAYEHEKKSKIGDLVYISEHINELIEETNKTIVLIQEYMNGDDNLKVNDIEVEANDVFDKKTILVIDDSNIVRNFVKRIFSDKYTVGVAKDGEEAIAVLNANKDNELIEAILLDLKMPKVDGFGVLEYMRQNDLLKKMPVSIISGDSSKETIDRAFTYEIVDMLEKPFNDQTIKMIVEKTIMYKNMNK